MIENKEILEIAANYEIEVTYIELTGKYQAFDGYHYLEYDTEEDLLNYLKDFVCGS